MAYRVEYLCLQGEPFIASLNGSGSHGKLLFRLETEEVQHGDITTGVKRV